MKMKPTFYLPVTTISIEINCVIDTYFCDSFLAGLNHNGKFLK